MNSADNRAPLRIEFRIPISPTAGFYAQVRLFDFALRKLGGVYREARIRVSVGDRCNIDQVRRDNRWSENTDVVWDRVPDALFDQAGIWGTANWRLNLPADGADVIILSDADTVMLRDVDPILAEFAADHPVVRGHMAHYPPPLGEASALQAGETMWPTLLRDYGVEHSPALRRYSYDVNGVMPMSPAYFNLGFVAMNATALGQFGHDIHWTEAWLREHSASPMRCQIALTLIACRRIMDIDCISAAYNTANDELHMAANDLAVSDIRVLHYLREGEFLRRNFLLKEEIENFMNKKMQNPCNMKLQRLVREFSSSI